MLQPNVHFPFKPLETKMSVTVKMIENNEKYNKNEQYFWNEKFQMERSNLKEVHVSSVLKFPKHEVALHK